MYAEKRLVSRRPSLHSVYYGTHRRTSQLFELSIRYSTSYLGGYNCNLSPERTWRSAYIEACFDITKHVKSEHGYTGNEVIMGTKTQIYNARYLTAYQDVFAPGFCSVPSNKSISVSNHRERGLYGVKTHLLTMQELHEFKEVTETAIRMAEQMRSQVAMSSIADDSDTRDLESDYERDQVTSVSRRDTPSPFSLLHNAQSTQFRSRRLRKHARALEPLDAPPTPPSPTPAAPAADAAVKSESDGEVHFVSSRARNSKLTSLSQDRR